MISTLTNGPALTALQNLNAAGADLAATQASVASGLAAPGPAQGGVSWSIAQTLRGQLAGWQASIQALNRGQSILDVAASGASQISDLLNSLKQKALALSDTSLTTASTTALTGDVQALVDQIDHTASSAAFDGVNLLQPVYGAPIALAAPTGGAPSPSLSFSTAMTGQAGLLTTSYSLYNVAPNPLPTLTITGAAQTPQGDISQAQVAVATPSAYGQTVGVSVSTPYGDWTDFTKPGPALVGFAFSTSPFTAPAPPAAQPPASYGVTVQSVTLTPFRTQEALPASPTGDTVALDYRPMTSDWLGLSGLTSLDPASMVEAVDSAIHQANISAAAFGAQQNLVANQLAEASQIQDQVQAGVGELVDANMAVESRKLQADQLRQQLATQALAIANAQPQSLLSLFQQAA